MIKSSASRMMLSCEGSQTSIKDEFASFLHGTGASISDNGTEVSMGGRVQGTGYSIDAIERLVSGGPWIHGADETLVIVSMVTGEVSTGGRIQGKGYSSADIREELSTGPFVHGTGEI